MAPSKLETFRLTSASRELIDLSTYTKAQDWSYEREWRILSYADANDEELYSDWRFEKRDLASVYLGPSINEADAAELIAATKLYPRVEIFRTTVGMDRDLHFQKIEA